MKVSSASEVRAMDRTAIDDVGIPEELLMENAGQAVYFTVLRELGIEGKRFLVLGGLGNNSGAGLVAAQETHANRGWVKACILGDPKRLKGAAKLNADILARLPVEMHRLRSIGDMGPGLAHCDAIGRR